MKRQTDKKNIQDEETELKIIIKNVRPKSEHWKKVKMIVGHLDAVSFCFFFFFFVRHILSFIRFVLILSGISRRKVP